MRATARRLLPIFGLLVLSACGAAEIEENDDLISGRWRVTALSVADESYDTRDVFIELSSARSSLRVDSNCHGLYGSFTFADDGRAGFTVPGASTNECAAADQQLEDALVASLESVTSWRQEGQRLLFSGSGSTVELTPVG